MAASAGRGNRNDVTELIPLSRGFVDALSEITISISPELGKKASLNSLEVAGAAAHGHGQRSLGGPSTERLLARAVPCA